jgi:hypothetical protein
VIEFNPTLSNSALFVQKKDHRTTHGSSPASLVELGRRKGYELIAATSLNLLFVKSEHYGAFDIADNSLALMRDDSHAPRIFVGYDGHVFLSGPDGPGCITLPWHGLKLKEADVQVLSKHLQKYPDQYTRTEKFLFRLTLALQNPRRALRRLLHPWSGQTADKREKQQ